MNGKRIFCALIVLLLAASLVVADDEPRVPTSTLTDKDIVRTDAPTPATAEPGLGEQMQPMLEAGLAQIEMAFGEQMESLKAEFASATTEDAREAVQQRMMQLKKDWSLAIIDRYIELARERGDSEAEAEEMAAKNALLNPPVMNVQPVPRDPSAGIHIEGGAK